LVNAVSSEHSGLKRAVVTGAPVRDAVLAVDRSDQGRERLRAQFEIPSETRVLAIVGGSLGARTLNNLALELRRTLADDTDLLIYHVCGARNESEVRAAIAASQLPKAQSSYRLVPYEEHLPELFGAADLVVTRAGAMTVAELAVIGVPAILVPLPGAPGDHQALNARSLEDVGAAVVIRDEDATAERIGELVTSLLGADVRLREMERAAKSVARPDAAVAIAQLVRSTMDNSARRPSGAR
jgi:UDP-N-acetylglucosamine:LPS N-acetylglucosamine transferase